MNKNFFKMLENPFKYKIIKLYLILMIQSKILDYVKK